MILWLWRNTAAKSTAYLIMLIKTINTDQRCGQLNTQQLPYEATEMNNKTYSPIFPFPKQPTISHKLMRKLIHPVAGFHTPSIASTRLKWFPCAKLQTVHYCYLQLTGSHLCFHTFIYLRKQSSMHVHECLAEVKERKNIINRCYEEVKSYVCHKPI